MDITKIVMDIATVMGSLQPFGWLALDLVDLPLVVEPNKLQIGCHGTVDFLVEAGAAAAGALAPAFCPPMFML